MEAVTTLGLGKTMEKKLHSVGIHSAEELIEAAIRGVEIKQLEDHCKAELRTYFKSIDSDL